jgi:hypothetical protein
MLRWASPLPWAVALLAAGALLSMCAPAPDSGENGPTVAYGGEETAQLLPGSWLREYAQEGVHVRRLLVLEARGGFRELSRVVDATGAAQEFVNEGTWLYDGTNLKRRYTLMNGRPPSRLNVPFATFEIAFESRNAFTGVDHIHRRTIRYRRVQPETEL